MRKVYNDFMGFDISREFERQIENLIATGYPKLAGLTEKDFVKLLQPLGLLMGGIKVAEPDLEKGYLPFVIVVKNELVSTESMLEKTRFNGRPGTANLNPLTPGDFKIIEGMSIPKSNVYLIADVDRGLDSVGVTPENALAMIKRKHRFPLTIDEGIAVVTQFPHFLMKNNCFSLLASRTGKDQRVPALWINSAKQANLGWCWDRNPHTWLGSASTKTRIGT